MDLGFRDGVQGLKSGGGGFWFRGLSRVRARAFKRSVLQ